MYEIIVTVQVKPEFTDRFTEALHTNALHTLQEPAAVTFDVLQDQEDPTWFIMHEKFHTDDGYDQHMATAHYRHFHDLVEPWIATPRVVRRCRRIVGEIMQVDDLPR